MKVDVLTVEQVSIGKYRWWSNWIDVAVFDYGSCGYLLQMKVSRRNAKRFKAVEMKSAFGCAHASISHAGNLVQMARE